MKLHEMKNKSRSHPSLLLIKNFYYLQNVTFKETASIKKNKHTSGLSNSAIIQRITSSIDSANYKISVPDEILLNLPTFYIYADMFLSKCYCVATFNNDEQIERVILLI